MPKSLFPLIREFPLTHNAMRQPAVSRPAPRPFIQWVGGKREFLVRNQHLIPPFSGRYFEPFLGGGAVFFRLAPPRAILADSNADLINAYECIRDQPRSVVNVLRELKARHSADLYLAVRGVDRDAQFLDIAPAHRAARFIYLNQTGFNGLYRVNRKGQFNVPLGSSLNRLICDPGLLYSVSRFLKPHTFTVSDFDPVLSQATRGDFVFLDPPYVPAGGYSDFVRYTADQFTESDQQRVAQAFKKAARRGAKVLLTNSDTPYVRNAYRNFYIHEITSSRNLNCKREHRGDVSELAITNYKAERP